MQQLVIASNTLKQLIIPEYYMGVYHKGGCNANGRTSIFVVGHDYVKKGVFEIKQSFLANAIILILVLTSYRSRTLVRICFHLQLHPKPQDAFDIPDVIYGRINGLTFSEVYL